MVPPSLFPPAVAGSEGGGVVGAGVEMTPALIDMASAQVNTDAAKNRRTILMWFSIGMRLQVEVDGGEESSHVRLRRVARLHLTPRRGGIEIDIERCLT